MIDCRCGCPGCEDRRARIASLELQVDENASEVMRLQGELSEERSKLSDIKSMLSRSLHERQPACCNELLSNAIDRVNEIMGTKL